MLFYECTVKYGRETEDGLAQVKESYLIEGMTPTDVERRLMDEIKPFISGDCEVPSICKKQVFDLFKHEGGDNWYWVKPEMITVEDSGKELRKKVNILVQASTVRQAIDIATANLNGMDYEIVEIKRSHILEVFRVQDYGETEETK